MRIDIPHLAYGNAAVLPGDTFDVGTPASPSALTITVVLPVWVRDGWHLYCTVGP